MRIEAQDPTGGREQLLSEGPVLAGWLTRAELARELRVSPDTLARWHSMRIGPVGVRVGGRFLYRKGAVQDWLLAMEQRSAARRS